MNDWFSQVKFYDRLSRVGASGGGGGPASDQAAGETMPFCSSPASRCPDGSASIEECPDFSRVWGWCGPCSCLAPRHDERLVPCTIRQAAGQGDRIDGSPETLRSRLDG